MEKPSSPRYELEEYKVKHGDTLFQIAFKSQIPLKLLKSLNPNLLGEAPLFSGDVIMVPKKVTFDQEEKDEN